MAYTDYTLERTEADFRLFIDNVGGILGMLKCIVTTAAHH